MVLEYDRTLADNSSAVDKNVIKQSLSFLLLVEHLYPHALSRLSVATKLARVMCVFIIGMCNNYSGIIIFTRFLIFVLWL